MTNLLEESKKICQQNRIEIQKRFGQNFLIDNDVYEKIIEVADLNNNDIVLEVGPGLGFLTERLARFAKKVISVEIDSSLLFFLKDKFLSLSLDNIQLIHKDILTLKENIKYNKIVANLPYNISAHFLFKYLSQRDAPDLMILMLQREVVERICASAGKMSILAVSVQYFAQASLVALVAKESFWPQPKVDSAIVKIVKKDKKSLASNDEKEFFRLVKAGFSARRKMLKNNLANFYKITQSEIENKFLKIGLDLKLRAQDLSLADWEKLFGTFY